MASATTVDAVGHDHGVGGLRRDGRSGRAHRDADVGEGERRRVVDAVAHHHAQARRSGCAQRSDDLELSLGGAARRRRGRRRSRFPTASATARRSPVTIATWSMPAARRSSRSVRASGRSRSESVIVPATRPSTPTTTVARPSSAATDGFSAAITAASQPVEAADGDAVRVDASLDALRRALRSSPAAAPAGAPGAPRRAPAPRRARAARAGRRRRRAAAARGLRDRRARSTRSTRRFAGRQRAGLVEQHRAHPPELLDRRRRP